MQPQKDEGHLSNRCDVCGRSFARNEHLVRHQRAHTSERPFQCIYCQRSFSRLDVHNKHMRRCQQLSPQYPTRIALGSSSGGVVRQPRSRLACNECRQRKLKCGNQRPCESCRKRSVECIDRSGRQRPKAIPGPSNTNLCSLKTASLASEFSSNQDDAEFDASRQASFAIDLSISHGGQIEIQQLPSHLLAAGVTPESPTALPMSPDPIDTFQTEFYLTNQHGLDPSLYMPPSNQQERGENTGISMSSQTGIEADMMDILSDLPGLDYEFWLQEFDGVVTNGLPTIGHSGAMQNAISIMKDYFQRQRRRASPLASDPNSMWYSAPPRLQIYDKEVMNAFLNLAKANLADSFPVLSPFEAFADTEVELVVAMTAVGGLFCDVEGSHKIASALYNDARRLVLAKTRSSVLLDFRACLNRAKTFLLLEIYGLNSGDGRSYEFVEAFHGFILQAAHKCKCLLTEEMSSGPAGLQMNSLFAALQVLDCYRVFLLQRPPTLTASWNRSLGFGRSPSVNRGHWLYSLKSLMAMSENCTDHESKVASLAALSRLSWFSSPHGPFGWREPSLWKTDFVELGLSQWMDAQNGDVDAWTLLLYHMAHINLHSNIGLLQRVARLRAKAAQTLSSSDTFSAIERWLASRHYAICRWHAESLLKVIQAAMGGAHRSLLGLRSSKHVPKVQKLASEPPHLPFCIYYAILVLWYGGRSPGQDHPLRNSWLEVGSQILGALKVRVAKYLREALYELVAEEE